MIVFFVLNDTATTKIYTYVHTLSLHDALPILAALICGDAMQAGKVMGLAPYGRATLPVSAFFTIDDDGCFHYSESLLERFKDLEPWPNHAERFADLAEIGRAHV